MKNAPTRLGPRRATMTSDQSSIEDSRILSEVSPRAQPSPSPSQLLAVFRERCGAQALMVAEGMLALQDAVDTLQQAAIAQELVDHFGQDEIQRYMADAFKTGGRRWIS
jgi:hypothetical protein